jgi:hypothetical protein
MEWMLNLLGRDGLRSFTSGLDFWSRVITLLLAALGMAYMILNSQLRRIEDEEAKRQKQVLAELQSKNLQLGIDLERERANRLEMQRKLLEVDQRVRPRTFTSQQRAELTALLKAFPGQKVRIAVDSDQSEPRRFATELSDALKSCGWEAGMGPWNNSNREGLSIAAPTISPGSAGRILHETLLKFGIENDLGQNKAAGEIVVTVGIKTPTGMK